MCENIVMWGAGEFAKRFLRRIQEKVVAIIDSDKSKVGSELNGIPIISYEEYEVIYSNLFILITPIVNDEIVLFLQKKGNYRYFKATDMPGEWFDYNERHEYKNYLVSLIDTNEKYYVYGCNYHAVLLVNMINKQAKEKAIIIVNKSETKEVADEVNRDICEVIDLKDVYFEDNTVLLVATQDDIEDLAGIKTKIIETWDCKSIIPEYKNADLEKYKNLYFGKRCFIIGGGPSLKAADLTVLYDNKELCFGVNAIFDIYPYTRWRPDFYAAEDVVGIRSGKSKIGIRYGGIKATFVADRVEEEYYKGVSCDIFHQQAQISTNKPPKFSLDLTTGTYYGGTILYSCIQMAVYMGFSEIYLLGVDFTGGASGTKTRYQGFGGNEYVGCLFNRIVYNAYLAVKDQEEKSGFRVFNATRGGELEVFDRVDFDKLFYKKETEE